MLLGNVRSQLHGLMTARAPLYEQVATLVLDTDELSPEQAVGRVLSELALDVPAAAQPGSGLTDSPQARR